MNRGDRMLQVLLDGRWHSRRDILDRSDKFFLTNNAASELRARGYRIEHKVMRGLDVYRFGAGPLEAATSSTPTRSVASSSGPISCDASSLDGRSADAPTGPLPVQLALTVPKSEQDFGRGRAASGKRAA